jgi:putative heme-binding domain-containing protein
LTKSSARTGSPARGAEVFKKASCSKCHVFNPAGGSTEAVASTPGTNAQWGPDLTTVGRRFTVEQLLESIDFPSRVISDQYRTSVIEIEDDRYVDGRIVARDEQTLTVLSSDGSRRTLETSEVKDITPSKVSPMPEGLLSVLTLEEIKDLFAFLRSDGRIEEPHGEDASWTGLFDGKQRTNWTYDPNHWNLKDGVLIGRADDLPQSSWVLSKTSYRDFEIEFDVFMPNGNSGFQFRSKTDAEKPDPVGYQADIGQGYWGSLYATDGRELLAAAAPEVWRAAVDPLGWNHFYVRARGDEISIEINGIATVDAHDAEHPAGSIGFQLHQGMKMEVRFANMRIHLFEPH